MTMAVTRKEGMLMATTSQGIGLMATMATGNEIIIPRRGSSMHRLHRRASVYFSRQFLFLFANEISICGQPGVQAELIRAVTGNAARHE